MLKFKWLIIWSNLYFQFLDLIFQTSFFYQISDYYPSRWPGGMKRLPGLKQLRRLSIAFVVFVTRTVEMAFKWVSSGETGYAPIDSTTHRIRHFCESNTTVVYLWQIFLQHIFWALLPSILIYDLYKTTPTLNTILLLWLVLVIFLCIYRAEDILIYQPGQPEDARFNCQGLPDQHRDNLEGNKLLDSYQINWIQSTHAVLDSVFLLLPEELRKTRPTILYLHGNAGSIGHRIFGGDVFHLYKNHVLMISM